MRILLTGATGFIGGFLLPRLAALHEVVAALRPGTPRLDGADCVDWDMAQPLDSGKFPGRIDAVINLALSPHFRDFPGGAKDIYRVNVAANMELLEYARSAGAGCFLLASTGNMNAPDYDLKSGEVPVPPNDLYTASKVAAEALMRPYRSCFGASVLRIFFPYGPGQTDKTIPNLISRVRAGRPVTLRGGDTGDTLSLTYVEDLADLMIKAIEEAWSGFYDVAGPEKLPVRTIAEEIGRQIGTQPIFDVSDEQSQEMVADLSALSEKFDPANLREFSAGLKQTLSVE